MKKVYLDCGSNVGETVTKFLKCVRPIPIHIYDMEAGERKQRRGEQSRSDLALSWEIHMFEPNPICHKPLSEFESENITLHKCAVSDSNESQMLNIQYCNVAKDWVGEGTNILTSNHWIEHYKQNTETIFVSEESELSFPAINSDLDKAIIQEKFLEVECIRFSDFIQENFKPKDFIVLKLDIEGSEFAVIDDMIATGTMDYINEIYIEFHEKLLDPNKEGKTDRREKYISYFSKNNIFYQAWY